MRHCEKHKNVTVRQTCPVCLLDEIQRLNDASPWRRVEDELPRTGGRYLTRHIGGGIIIKPYARHMWERENTTHWMPIPELPKG